MDKGIAFREEYLHIGFTPPSILDNWTRRVRVFMKMYRETGLSNVYSIIFPKSCSLEELLLAHSKSYLDYVKKMGEKGEGFLDYGDTPAYKNVFEKARIACGGTLTLARMIEGNKLKIGFNPQGGFHHAKRNVASGFCVFNDIAIAAKFLRGKGFQRIAIIDIDGHHGDGTQKILYSEDILKISFHMYEPPWFYPGTGDIYELGEGAGLGYSVNIPLPEGAGDDLFIYAIEKVVLPVLNFYRPEMVIGQMGVDAHLGDPLVGLRLTSSSYRRFAEVIREVILKYTNEKFLGTAGGGYSPEVTARMWILMLAKIAEYDIELERIADKKENTVSDPYKREKFERKIKLLQKKLGEIHGINFS